MTRYADMRPIDVMLRQAEWIVPAGPALPAPQIAGLLPAMCETTRQKKAQRIARIWQRLLDEEKRCQHEIIALPVPRQHATAEIITHLAEAKRVPSRLNLPPAPHGRNPFDPEIVALRKAAEAAAAREALKGP